MAIKETTQIMQLGGEDEDPEEEDVGDEGWMYQTFRKKK
jgi:hypothetical protein